MSCRQHGYPWPSLVTSPYRSSPLVGLQGCIPYPHIAAACMFVLVVLLLLGHMWGSIGVHHLSLYNSRGIWVHAFEFNQAENLSAQNMDQLGATLRQVLTQARWWMEVSLRCLNSPRWNGVTGCGWRYAPEARGGLCEIWRKLELGTRRQTRRIDFWSLHTRGELALYEGCTKWGSNE